MSTLWVIGDSTVSSFEDKYYYPRYGYGTMLDKYLDDSINVVNIALSGRSTKSYTTEPQYNELLSGMKQGDFLIIGFGHNDEKTEESRFTDANGDYKTEGSFAHSLYANYIANADKAGCKTILCTPIVRRTPTGEWSDTLLHITKDVGTFKGGDYPEAIRKLGSELNIPVVDMTEKTHKLYDELGASNTLYLHAWPSDNELSVDNTHTNIWGARVNAYMVMSAVKELGIEGLSEHIINLSDNPVEYKEKYLVSNPDYKPVVFSDKLEQSKLFEDYGGYKGTVFGDVLENVSSDNFTLEADKDGNMHIAVRNNMGKISAVTDGIAMYYKKVDITQNFRLSAKVRVNKIFSNDQVSFGLMVRDDCYIDECMPDILGDYVAAAPLCITRRENTVGTFARKSGKLVEGPVTGFAIEEGKEYSLVLSSSQDGYMAQFADGPEVTGGYDFKLTAIDPAHVYVGMFAARNVDVTFYDIKWEDC